MFTLATTALTSIAAAATVLGLPALRRQLITRPFMPIAAKMLPTIGATERIALEAGSVWLEGDIFKGQPDWQSLLDFPIKPLSAKEKAFLDGPVTQLCGMLNDWEIVQQRDLPKEVWDYLKREKFFGMIIPEEQGGLGFSAAAHAEVVTRIASRSITAAVTVMVPNSLGPAELLLHYGTDEQRAHYLPRLADGRELPCFGLTEPHAGSDAANITSHGVVSYGQWQGQEVLGIRLNFNKRYITLAPVATVIGLAFTLSDPDHLLGAKEGDAFGRKTSLGITLALLPRTLAGLKVGARHDPMGVPFQNGPVVGKDVFIPMDMVIGGQAQIGNGWRMLMECLAAGRGISLPSLSVGAAQLAARATSAHALVREQFGMPVGKFEGVRERLARIAGLAYSMHATRRLTTGGLDAGHKPSVLAAISKASLTEGMRTSLNDAMDLLAGSTIMRGPGNIFAHPYTSIPIGITVEGANILTRSLIIFGQGVMRCHPHLLQVVNALQKRDLKAFDKALFSHVGHAVATALRSFLHGISAGYLTSRGLPARDARAARAMRHIARLSAAFAILTEIGLIGLGGALKRKEYLTGRYADALSWLTIAGATLKRDHDDHHDTTSTLDEPARKHLAAVRDYALADAIYKAEQALDGIIANLPGVPLRLLARVLALPLGARLKLPSDRLTDAAAEALLQPAVRHVLTPSIHVPEGTEPGLGVLESAYQHTIAVAPARAQLAAALKTGKLQRGPVTSMVAEAHRIGLLTKVEHDSILKAWTIRDAAVQVQAFPAAAYLKQR